jgi:hypothetical protein
VGCRSGRCTEACWKILKWLAVSWVAEKDCEEVFDVLLFFPKPG